MVRADWSNHHRAVSAESHWMAGGAGAHRRRLATVLAGAICTVCLLWPVLLSAQTVAQQEAGKHIYVSGESPSGNPLEAVLGEGSTTVPGTLMPCAGCHGTDGKGRPEGGVTPSDITWSVLTRRLRSADPLARNRPAYSVETLRKVLREGIDSAGNDLGVTMPRYKIAEADVNSLMDYLKHLGAASDPGLSHTVIRIGTVIPAAGAMTDAGENMARLLRAYFDEVNHQGGIYERRIELEVLKVGGTPAAIATQLDGFVREKEIFAIVGVLVPGAEPEIDELLERAEVPVIDAFATERSEEQPAKSRVFHVLSGLAQQARVLIKYAQSHPDRDGRALALVFPQARKFLAETVIQECRVPSCNLAPTGYSNFEAAKLAAALRAQKAGTVLFLGTGQELEQLLSAAQVLNWRPLVFQPGPLAGEDVFRIPPEFNDRVFFSFPTLPSDIVPVALEEYAFLGRKYKLTPFPPLRALSALAPAKVFAEGLRQAGRELSREKLVETLSGMYNFPTGWTPPVSYGATRRVGALGAYVVKLNLKDKSFAPVEPWMVP